MLQLRSFFLTLLGVFRFSYSFVFHPQLAVKSSQFQRRLAAEGPQSDSQPASPRREVSRKSTQVYGAGLLVSALVSGEGRSVAAESDVKRREEAFLDVDALKNDEVNIQSDDFWYPPFLIGEWNTAKFVDDMPIQELAVSGELPGLLLFLLIVHD